LQAVEPGASRRDAEAVEPSRSVKRRARQERKHQGEPRHRGRKDFPTQRRNPEYYRSYYSTSDRPFARSAEVGDVFDMSARDLKKEHFVLKSGGKGMGLGFTKPEALRLGEETNHYASLLGMAGLTPWSDARLIYDKAAGADGVPVKMVQRKVEGLDCEKVFANVVAGEDDVVKVLRGLLGCVTNACKIKAGKFQAGWEEGDLCFGVDCKPANYILSPSREDDTASLPYIDVFLPLSRDAEGTVRLIDGRLLKDGARRMTHYDKGFTSVRERLFTDVGLFLKLSLETLAALSHNPKYEGNMDEARRTVEKTIQDYIKRDFKKARGAAAAKRVLKGVRSVMRHDYIEYTAIAGDGECARFANIPFIDQAMLGFRSAQRRETILRDTKVDDLGGSKYWLN